MSISYIGSDALTSPVTPLAVPGFDVLNPTSYAESANGSTASTSSTNSPSSPSSTGTALGQNPYQQVVATLAQWQYATLTQGLTGDTSGAATALYATAGLNVDQFAELANQLQNLGSTTGSLVDTTA